MRSASHEPRASEGSVAIPTRQELQERWQFSSGNVLAVPVAGTAFINSEAYAGVVRAGSPMASPRTHNSPRAGSPVPPLSPSYAQVARASSPMASPRAHNSPRAASPPLEKALEVLAAAQSESLGVPGLERHSDPLYGPHGNSVASSASASLPPGRLNQVAKSPPVTLSGAIGFGSPVLRSASDDFSNARQRPRLRSASPGMRAPPASRSKDKEGTPARPVPRARSASPGPAYTSAIRSGSPGFTIEGFRPLRTDEGGLASPAASPRRAGSDGCLSHDELAGELGLSPRSNNVSGPYSYHPLDAPMEINPLPVWISTLHSESDRDVPELWLYFLFFAWSYGALAWVLGVGFPSASLDFLPGTDMEWHMTKSLAQTLHKLLAHRVYGSFTALGFFSVVVPLVKISCTLLIIYKMSKQRVKTVFDDYRTLMTVLGYLASYQFVDLYVGIMFVRFFNGDASDARFEVGFYWFFSYCIVSLSTSVLLEYVVDTYKASKPGADAHSPAGHTMLNRSDRVSISRDGEQVVEVSEGDLGPSPRTNSRLCRVEPQDVEGARGITPSREQMDDGGQLAETTYTDKKTAYFFSACFLIFASLCSLTAAELLEVRMLMHGVAVDRQALSIKEAMLDMLPRLAHPIVTVFLWLVTIAAPLLYTVAIIIRVSYPDHRGLLWRIANSAADVLRQWAMPDVVAISALIFLFMIQDAHTLTMPPDGSCGFYIFLGAGFSFFILRWFIESDVSESQGWAHSVRFVVLAVTWLAICAVIFHGVPGQAPHFRYQSLSAICEHTRPFLNQAVDQAPASYGNCKDVKSKPPQPCLGDENLHTEGDKNGYMNAVWIGGLRTTSFKRCKLEKRPTNEKGQTQYRLSVGGVFGHLSMFLRVKSCNPLVGCTRINTADNCCGDNLGFNFSFLLSCKPPSMGKNAIRSVEFERADIDPMIVSTKLMEGAIKVDAMDISPRVEHAVSEQVEGMLHRHIPWGGKPLNLAQILNKIVWYNAPSNAGTCF